MKFKVKALDADNEVEVNQLCSLYSKSYGAQCILTGVDSTRFWKLRAGNRFTTIIVRAGSKLIASVSLRPDRDNSSHVQLYMPVCDPDYLGEASEIRHALADVMHRLSIRQDWEMLYSYQFLQLPEQAWFSHFLVDGVDVALWPASLPSGSKRNQKKSNALSLGSVLISQRILAVPETQATDKTVLFSPKEHVEFCRWIYQSLGISFPITNDLQEASKQFSSHEKEKSVFASNMALSADRRAIERHTHRQAGFSICFVEPSLAGSFKDIENLLDRRPMSADYVALNMLDPKTPQFAEHLESKGFGLGGVLPYHRNRHTLLFYRTAQPFDWKSIRQNSTLFDYLKTKDNSSLRDPSRSEVRKVPANRADS